MIDESVAIDSRIICSSEDTVGDVVGYCGSTIFLLNSGMIIKESTNSTVKITSNKAVESIVVFDDNLYGVYYGVMYMLDYSTYETNSWTWKATTWAIDIVESVSTTLDGKHIIIKSGNIYVYDRSLKIVKTINMAHGPMVRIYGNDLDHYIDWDKVDYTATVYQCDQSYTLRDVSGAIITHDAEVIAVDSGSEDYDSIRYVNGEVYYVIGKYKLV